MIHDPQPLPLVKFYPRRQPWVWRCHVDLSKPNEKLREFLKGFIIGYDPAVVSSDKYIQRDLPVQKKIIYPAIDPLTPKTNLGVFIDRRCQDQIPRRIEESADLFQAVSPLQVS